MRIREAYTASLAGVRRTSRRRISDEGIAEVSATDRVDEVLVSSRSFELQQARNAVLRAPDIREDLVQEVGREIEEGRYHVGGAEVMQRMLREQLDLVR